MIFLRLACNYKCTHLSTGQSLQLAGVPLTPLNGTKERQSEDSSLHKHSLQQRAGLRQSRRGRRQPRPTEWCHWCSLPSATNGSPRCLSSSASWLPPLPSSFWGLSAGPSHRIGHRPAWSILFSPQKLLCLGKGIKGLLDTEAGGTRKDFQRRYQAMIHLPLWTQLPIFLFAGMKMVQISVWINVTNYKMMLIVGSLYNILWWYILPLLGPKEMHFDLGHSESNKK